MKGQGLRIGSKCLWDPNFDGSASYTFTNESIHCTGIVFGCYTEWIRKILKSCYFVR